MKEQLQPCRLLNLPSELRNRIYLLVLEKGPGRIRFYATYKVHSQSRYIATLSRADSIFGIAPNILATCHQIHDEATPNLYGSNAFSFGWDYISRRAHFLMFINKIGRSARHLRNIELEGESTQTKAIANLVALRKSGAVLATLSLGVDYQEIFNAEELALALRPLFRTQYKQYRLTWGEANPTHTVGKLDFPSKRLADVNAGTIEEYDDPELKEVQEAKEYSDKVKAALLAMLK